LWAREAAIFLSYRPGGHTDDAYLDRHGTASSSRLHRAERAEGANNYPLCASCNIFMMYLIMTSYVLRSRLSGYWGNTMNDQEKLATEKLEPEIEEKLADWMSAQWSQRGLPAVGWYSQLAEDAVQALGLPGEAFPRAWVLAHELADQRYGKNHYPVEQGNEPQK
jgi:hypothetical protein